MKNLNKTINFPVKHFIGNENAKHLKKINGLKSPGFFYKTNIQVLILCVVVLSFGCRKDSLKESVNITPVKRYPVHFSAGFSGSETVIKAQKSTTQALSAQALKNQIYYLSYYVTRPDQPNVVLKRIDQRYTDPNFGTINDTLAAGKYRIYFVGTTHPGNDVMPLSWFDSTPMEERDLYITYTKLMWRPDSIGDNFLKKLDLTIPGPISQDITLKRNVGKVKVVIQDPIPASVFRIEVYYNDIPGAYDLFTDQGNGGSGSGRGSIILNHIVKRTEVGKSGLTFGLTSWPSSFWIEIRAYNAKNQQTFSKIVEEYHQVKANAMLTFKGNVFTTAGGFTALADTAWDSRTTFPFEEF